MQHPVATPRAAAAVGPYSQGVVCEGKKLVFTAGQIGLDPATGTLVSGGVLPEFDRAIANVRAILEAAGASLENVVKVTVFFADLSDFTAVNERYAAAFREPYPARSAVGVAALPKGARVEVEAIAVVP